MDYETADGSQFSLREEYDDAEQQFQGTLITAFVEGNAYVGKSPLRMKDLDDSDVFQLLEPVPRENIFPVVFEGLTVAAEFNPRDHYLKAPQFTYEDREPGRTFVADRMRREIDLLERLKDHPHPSIVSYYGCVVKEGRVSHICLQRYPSNLADWRDASVSKEQCEGLLTQIRDGIEHLHGLGFAHNDINEENICVDDDGCAVIIDFDSALPFGERVLKGMAANIAHVSHRGNDFMGLSIIQEFLLDPQDGVGEKTE